jgi:hypothetical protein
MLKKQSTLKVDKDCVVPRKWLLDYVHRVILPLCVSHKITSLSIKYCPSKRKGFHLYINITPAISAVLALELQFLMGDDAQRVSLCRARMRAGYDEWNKHFEEPHCRLRTLYRTSQLLQQQKTKPHKR